MAVITVYGKTPDVGSAAFVAPNATLAGDVVLAAGSSVWYGAVVRGDTGAIRIGKNSNIQDNAVLHTGPNLGVTIGKNVSIGHSAVVHGCTVGDGALIGMHATVMNGAVVGKNAVVAAGALVLENTVVPDGMVAMGVPAKVREAASPALAEEIAWDFWNNTEDLGEVMLSGENMSYLMERGHGVVDRIKFIGNNYTVITDPAQIPEDIVKVSVYLVDGVEPFVERFVPKWQQAN